MIYGIQRQPGHDSIVAETPGDSTLDLPIHDKVRGELRPILAIELLQGRAPRVPAGVTPEVGDHLNIVAALALALRRNRKIELELDIK